MRDIDPETRTIRCFLAVADELHFGRAAQRLHLSQPSVSRAVRTLEDALGVELFVRNSRNVELTPAGATLRAHAPRGLDELTRAVRLTREAAAAGDSSLAVSYLPSARSLVLEATRRYRGRFDRVHLTLNESLSEPQCRRLLQGALDVAVVRGHPSDPRLVVQTLASSLLCVALPARHPLAAAAELDYADLRGESFVLWPRVESPESFDRVVAGCELAGFEPRIVVESADAQTVASLVAAGWGISILSAALREFVGAGIAFVPLRGEADPLSVVRRAGTDSRTCLGFVELLLEIAGAALPAM